MVARVGTLIQSLTTIARNSAVTSQMDQLQRQISTGVKYQNFKDYGVETSRIQRFRAGLDQVEGFLRNIDLGETIIKQMDLSMEEICRP